MESFISVSNPIDRSRLKADDYFRTLVTEGADKGLLSELDFEKIYTELVELLGSVCLGISEKGHGSMKTEEAEKIAESIMYTVSVILKKSPSPESAIDRLKRESTESLFYGGRREIVSLLTKARGKWAVIVKELFETENLYYSYVINNSIKAFFADYNYELSAHKNPCEFDYPLYAVTVNERGAEYIYSYLSDFKNENSFLNSFSSESVHSLMMNLDAELKKTGFPVEKGAYRELPVNIFGFVFAASVVLEYFGKDIYSLNLSKADAEIFSKELEGKSYGQLVSLFEGITERIISEIGADKETAEYLRRSVRVLASEASVKDAAALTGMFLYQQDNEDTFEANETEKLSDSEYRKVLSLIASCKSDGERLEIIRKKIRNYEDFIDTVKDASLNAYEISKGLSFLDMAEKLRLFKRYNIYSFSLKEEDSKMKKALERYVDSLDSATKELILKMLSLMQ